MNLPEFSVKRPVSISMLFIGLVLLGFVSLLRLPVELKPNVVYGDISIIIEVRGGMPPQEVEALVTKPIEEAVSTVSHLENVYSTSKAGESRIWLEFEPGVDMDFAALEVREKFAKIRDKLPKEIEKPIIAQYKESDMPIMLLAVTGKNYTPEMLRRTVDEKLKERILRVEGVANVDVYGGRERKILVDIDQTRLQAHNIPIGQVVNAVSTNNLNLLAGDISQKTYKYLIRTMGEFKTLDDIRDIGVGVAPQGAIIKLRDVATVKDSFLEPSSYARTDIEPVVSIYIQKESTANTVKVVKNIEEELRKAKSILGKDIFIKATFNQADSIIEAINAVKNSLFYGAILAVLILLVTLHDLRPTFIIGVTIPISVMCTFILMFFQKISLNVMTLSGLALGIGMLVDNSIVVLDNIDKKKTQIQGVRAISEGASEMLLAIVASTVTTVVVFLPFVFVNKEIRMLWSPLAMTVTYSLLSSLFVALTLVPMLSSRMIGRFETHRPAKRLFKRSFQEKIKFRYRKVLNLSIRLRYLFIILAFLAFGGTTFLGLTKIDREFLVAEEEGRFTIFVELEPGAKLDVTDVMVKEIEKFLAKIPEVKTFTSRVEPWSSKIYVKLVPLKQRTRATKEVMDNIRQEAAPIEKKYKGGFIYFSEIEETGIKEVILDLYGYDYKVLKELAISMATRLGSIPGLEDIRMSRISGRPEWNVKVDKERAYSFGLSVQDIAETLHSQVRGLRATLFHTEAREIETVTRLRKEDRKRLDDLRKLTLFSEDGHPIFLEQIADFLPQLGASEIIRKNKTRVVHITAMVAGMSLEKGVGRVRQTLKDLEFPRDYYYRIGGDFLRNLESQKQLVFVLVLTIILVFMVLAALFETYLQPFIIMFTVPLAAIGVFLALFITHKPISRGVIIGAIMLAGIVVNNAIILVDRINFLRTKENGEKKERFWQIMRAAIKAGEDRLRPIFMTTSTTILGLIPMAFDRSESANLWSPLAITVIGGLTVSTILTLFLIPSMYIAFEDLKGFLANPIKFIRFALSRLYAIIKPVRKIKEATEATE